MVSHSLQHCLLAVCPGRQEGAGTGNSSLDPDSRGRPKGWANSEAACWYGGSVCAGRIIMIISIFPIHMIADQAKPKKIAGEKKPKN